MACNKLITTDILHSCSDVPKKGLDAGRAVLINFDEVDWTATKAAVTGSLISAITLQTGLTGFELSWHKELASVASSFAPNAEDVDGFSHSFLGRIPTTTADAATRSNELKNGRFVVVVETSYKGATLNEAFKVYGLENGLELSELQNSSNENSGSILFTLASREGTVEQYPYHVFLDTDYDTSKQWFDANFLQGFIPV